MRSDFTDKKSTTMFERHFKAGTLAELWEVSDDTILRLAEDEECLRVSDGKKDHVRIPESVAARIYTKHFRKRS